MDGARGGGSHSSANMASKGGRGGFTRGGGGRVERGPGGHGQKGGRGQGGSNNSGVTCQLCGKEGHSVLRCIKRFAASFTGPTQKSASVTTSSYRVDTNWYMDSGATDHVTGELEKLIVHDKYHGGDQVHNASGIGMRINQSPCT